MKSKVILKVGAEGGTITLQGYRSARGWRFSRELIDQTLLLIDETTIENSSEVVHTWQEALQLLDQHPWYRLLPLRVHPEFAAAIFEAVVLRSGNVKPVSDRRMEDWKAACNVAV